MHLGRSGERAVGCGRGHDAAMSNAACQRPGGVCPGVGSPDFGGEGLRWACDGALMGRSL